MTIAGDSSLKPLSRGLAELVLSDLAMFEVSASSSAFKSVRCSTS